MRRNLSKGRGRARRGRLEHARPWPIVRQFVQDLLPIAVGGSFLLNLLVPVTTVGQVPWLNFEDGDILNVSSATGPPSGQFLFRGRRGVETSTTRGTVAIHRMLFAYGLNDNMVLGASIPYLQQRYHGLYKQGLGDANLAFKIHLQPYADLPIRLGLRQSLSLPTGYELERPELLPFTTRQNDYAAQFLFQYTGSGVLAYLNPGVSLPGGDANSSFTGGFGLELTELLPLGLEAQAEYFTEWDMVERKLDADIFLGLSRRLWWDVSVEGGMKRRLLQNETVDPEWHLGFSLGQSRPPESDLHEVRAREHGPRAALLIHQIESMPPDPYGIGMKVVESFRARGNPGGEAQSVYVRTVPGEHLDALSNVRHYELSVKILEVRDGEVGGLSIPLLLRAPQGQTEISAQMTLIAPDGFSVVTRSVLSGRASRGLGADLVPTSTRLESLVTPDEIKEALRREAAEDLTQQILSASIWAIDERDAQ